MRESGKERRSSERFPATLAVRFSCENLLHAVYYGTVDNISETGLLVKTKTCFSINTDIRLFIYKEKILLVNAKVKRVVKVDDGYEAMGIEVVGPDKEYAEFVHDLKAATA